MQWRSFCTRMTVLFEATLGITEARRADQFSARPAPKFKSIVSPSVKSEGLSGPDSIRKLEEVA